MTLSEFQDVIKPKVQGTKYLADAFTTESLDFFVLLSSLAGVLGAPSQASYAASSTFQNIRDAGSRAERNVERSAESLVAQAPTVQGAEKIMLEAIRDRLSSLTAGDVSKNWITSTLQAPTQVGEILDSPGLRALASLVTGRSGLVKKTDNVAAVNGHQPACEAVTNGQVVSGKSPKKPKSKEDVITVRDDVQLPKLPLQPLETTMEVFLESISYLGSEKEQGGTRQAIAEFLSPGGFGRRLQARLEKNANDPSVDNWLSDVYINGLWLKTRNNSPQLSNFFGTYTLGKYPHSRADRATPISLAAYKYETRWYRPTRRIRSSSQASSSHCLVCLDNSVPENPGDRGDAFMKDDNTNRWLDKTVSLIICGNGASATFYEHPAIDGLTVYGLQEAIA
ncbi:hypothetical protein DL766_009827 [Monosporascus sp. MC13-8B]|uniref:Choline/carnitine acyltransferase domain-containing protein n=1 Tax=Monosporascus cannonballus TaxID=155416 RepID=A0ABY0GTE5_9PEZI|nr:hypothetical protein DL762_009731 [Monosporascus cannonballus]RYO78883.1 hypothetical protein DL763_009488 [Monosporascus cannonballus]RYP13550.1 hypothetical protein DL766_009827 [Monosporascus sp. MC13-8B]